MKTLLLVMSLAACGEHGRTPDPWGVPVTGGTMIVTKTNHAVIADPDRDRLVSVDLNTRQVISEVALDPGSEPGRIAEDGAGRIHVATRRGGQLLTFTSSALVGEPLRRIACAEPRGVAYEAARDFIHVACSGGELVTFQAESGQAVRSVHLDRDLRDIIVQGQNLVISRFRSAELLTVDSQGFLTGKATPPTVARFRFDNGPLGGGPDGSGQVQAVPSVAWRMIAAPDGTIMISHQRHVKATLDADRPEGYGGGCDQNPAPDAVSIIRPGMPIASVEAIHRIGRGALPVDIAVSQANDKIAVLIAGSNKVTVVDKLAALAAPDEEEGCGEDTPPPCPDGQCEPPKPPEPCDGDCDGGMDEGGGGGGDGHKGRPTSIGWTTTGDVVVFYPEAPGIEIRTGGGPLSQFVSFSGGSQGNPGRSVFHQQTRVGLSCATCHPEGREDGRVWSFRTLGQRRTQSLAGDILSRAPYHWIGDERNLPQLMDDVFAVRMGGGPLTVGQKESLGPWLNTVSAPAPFRVNAEAAARGKEIFNSAEAACGQCHNGAIFTNNTMADVGKGGVFKVPSLIGVGSRAPFMHDGTAPTLTERFGPLGGGDSHGRTSQLTQAQVSDLIAYLESL